MDIHSNQYFAINLNVRGIQPSATLRINEHSNELMAAGRRIIKLGLGQSPFPVPPSVVQSLRDNAWQKDYLPVKGLKRLRQAIADYSNRSQGVKARAEDVLVGPGSKELLFLLQLAFYGDLLIPRPSWVSYAPQARIIGRTVHWLPTHARNNWQLTADELDIICRDDPTRPRILIINYPSNPTGCTYSDEQLLAIANVARKYKLVLLSDEIYSELHYQGQHKSIARYYPEGTIISNGLSKWCGAGGWRLGYCVFPEELRPLQDAMAIIASETFTATSAPIQYAAVSAFEGSEAISDYLHHSRRILSALGDYFYRRLTAMGLDLAAPQGGFYVFPDFSAYQQALAKRDIRTSAALATALLEETGVAMLPASDFGFLPDTLSTRMAFVDFDGQQALDLAMADYQDQDIDEAFIHSACPRLEQALDALGHWLDTL